MASRIQESRVGAAAAGLVALLLGACGGSSQSVAPPVGNLETVTLRRDEFGVPHVFAETDTGAFYGLGWAVAEDRLFQMHWARTTIRGRTAAVMGRGPDDEFLRNDRNVRLTGYGRAADRMASELPPNVEALMVAYARGVNAYVTEHGTDDHPLFAQLGVDFEPWTPADSISVWLGLSRHFTPPSRPEAANYVKFQEALEANLGDVEAAIDAISAPQPVDEDAAVVLESDVDPGLRAEIEAYADSLGIGAAQARRGFDFGHVSPKFSHAWVVGGDASETGATMLVNDPQARIQIPSLFHEWHVVGESFDARGVSPPGSLVMIVGSTPDLVWGATSSGVDQRDLFLLKQDDDADPTQYLLDGAFRPFEVMEDETIQIAGEASEVVTYRESIFGPVVTELFDPNPIVGWGIAEKSVMLLEPASFIGIWDMFHAKTADELRTATAAWSAPSVNVVFGDRAGRVGFVMKGPVPLRSPDAPLGGRVAHEGTSSSIDWIEYIPHDYLPWVIEPASDALVSANHLPVGTWYPLPLGLGTGGSGDTPRSRRIRELLESFGTLDVNDMNAIQADVVNPSRRDIARLGEFLSREIGPLSASAEFAVSQLSPWLDLGAPMTADHPGSALAHFFEESIRIPALSAVWGGGENGLQLMLKTRLAEIEGGAPMPLTAMEQQWVEDQLEMAALAVRGQAGTDPTQWPAWYSAVVLTGEVEPWASQVDGQPQLVPDAPVTLGPLTCTDGNTVLAQMSQMYTQRVVLGSPEHYRTLLPIGQSEADPAHKTDQQAVHALAELKEFETVEDELIAAGATTTLLEFDPDV